MGAISIVTAGLFAQLTSLDVEAPFVAVILLTISVFVLGWGALFHLGYRVMKFIIILLTFSTVLALSFFLDRAYHSLRGVHARL